MSKKVSKHILSNELGMAVDGKRWWNVEATVARSIVYAIRARTAEEAETAVKKDDFLGIILPDYEEIEFHVVDGAATEGECPTAAMAPDRAIKVTAEELEMAEAPDED